MQFDQLNRREFITLMTAWLSRGRFPQIRSSRRCRWLGSSKPDRLTRLRSYARHRHS